MLTDEQCRAYEENGFLLIPASLAELEVDLLKAQLPGLFREESPARVLEKDGVTVRSVYGCHTRNAILKRLASDTRLAESAMQLLASRVYIYQFKVNVKAAFAGDVWEWHQDYIFWRNEDGMPSDRALNVVVFLDEVTEFNGPLLLLPGSHREQTIDATGNTRPPTGYEDDPAWIANLTADLKYSLGQATIAQLAARHPIVAPKGPAGSLLFFHGNLVHGSAQNMSPFDRKLLLVTYNSVENIPVLPAQPRPEFLVSRDYTAIEPCREVFQGEAG